MIATPGNEFIITFNGAGTAYVYEQGFIFLVNLKTGSSQQVAPTANSDGSNGKEDEAQDDEARGPGLTGARLRL